MKREEWSTLGASSKEYQLNHSFRTGKDVGCVEPSWLFMGHSLCFKTTDFLLGGCFFSLVNQLQSILIWQDRGLWSYLWPINSWSALFASNYYFMLVFCRTVLLFRYYYIMCPIDALPLRGSKKRRSCQIPGLTLLYQSAWIWWLILGCNAASAKQRSSHNHKPQLATDSFDQQLYVGRHHTSHTISIYGFPATLKGAHGE